MPTGVDIDNVLAVTGVDLINRLNSKFKKHYRYNDVKVFDIIVALSLEGDEKSYIYELIDSHKFYEDLKPIYRAAEGVRIISDVDDVIYVTSRPDKFANVTLEWLSKYDFPVGELMLNVTNKVIVAAGEECEAFIEDDPSQIAVINKKLAIPVYVPKCPWNLKYKNRNAISVDNWSELIDLVAGEE